MSGPRAAVAFLTPLGGAAAPSTSAFGWFPVVGAGIGALLGLLWWGMEHAWPAPVAAAVVVVAADSALTGLLHLDGLVDAADGLMPHLTRERRLAVMREPTIGAFGAVAGGAVLLACFAALSSMRPSILLFDGLWCGSRTGMAVIPSLVPYAERTPVASRRLLIARRDAVGRDRRRGERDRRDAVRRAALAAPRRGGRGRGRHVAAGSWCSGARRRRLGGYTGDVLGACGVVFETVALVVAAARW